MKTQCVVEQDGNLFPTKWNKMPSCSTLVMLWLALALTVWAQGTTGSISGRVVAEDGQPMSRVPVMVVASSTDAAKVMSGMRRSLTDNDGRFQADGLLPAAYQILVQAPGYVMAAFENPLAMSAHRIGDTPTVLMRKGAAITGRVTDAAGHPLVGIRVVAEPAEGSGFMMQMLSVGNSMANMQPRTTDDRGQFRLYGLPPGRYLIAANGAALMDAQPNPYSGQAPTYHPSATRDAATIVTLNSGGEASGVDIRFRGSVGYAVSGKLKGLAAGDGMVSSVTTVQLKQGNADNILATTMIFPMGGSDGFAFYGVANGEYELLAQQTMMKDQSVLRAAPLRVTVKDTDVTNLSLTLSAMASISGKLVLAEPAAPACKDARASELNEATLRLERAPATKKQPELRALFGEAAQSFVEENGAFRFFGLAAGTFWVRPDLPSPQWYVKAMAAEKPATVSAATGIALKAGEKLATLTLTLATDGAQLQGRVVAADKAQLARQIFLVPAEAETQSQAHRYAETVSANDGGFGFASLAPGKYWLVTRPAAKPDEPPRQPLAWDATERAKLVKEAAAANQAVELKGCQSLKQQEIKLP